MNRNGMVAVKQSESPNGVNQAYCNITSPMVNIFSDKLKGRAASQDTCASAHPSRYITIESISSSKVQPSSPFQSLKSSPNLELNSPMSYNFQLQYPNGTFSRSSTFCTNLYLSSSTSSETNRQLGNLPFLPHPPKSDQPIFDIHSSNSSLMPNDDLSNQFSEEQPEYLMMDFLNLSGDASDGSFHNINYASDNLTFTEQLELQILSEELDIAITDNSENPRVDEIYEAPQVPSVPTVGSNCNQKVQNHLPSLVPPVDDQTHSSQPSPGAAAAHKPRMRWTSELHDCFLNAVSELDGPEKATPKGILKLMKVEGLTIYHVKSHLQKYRLAIHLPENKEDKKASCSEEKETIAASNNNESDLRLKRGMQVTEALRMQMEVQKQLHEQLEVQRALQVRIEEQARYLQKIMEEQQRNFIPGNNLLPTTSTDPQTVSVIHPPHPDTESPQQQQQPESETDNSTTQRASDSNENENLSGHKRPREETKLEVSSPDESIIENPAQ